jgi:hypothetical protein
MLSQKEFVENCYNWYREADLQPGNPEDGVWDVAHYPIPKCKGGTETILLLREHHAIQGVIQSEELQCMCVFNWEKKYLSGEYLELFYKWKSEGMKIAHARHTPAEKILTAEKKRKTHAEIPEDLKKLRAERARLKTQAQLEKLSSEQKTLRAARLQQSYIQWREREAQELLARWKQGVIRW